VNENRFHLLIDSIPQFIWEARADGAGLFANKQMLAYLDNSLEQIQGQGWLASIHPDDRERVTDTWGRAVLAGEEYSTEFRIRNGRTGEYRWFLTRAVPHRNQQGQISRWFGTCTDIQNGKQIEHALRESEERFRTVLKNLPGGVFAHDLAGKFLLVNDAAAKNTGYSQEELLNLSVEDIDLKNPANEMRERLWQGLSRGESLTITSIHTRKDGSRYPTEIYLNAIELDGRPVILAIAMDITERLRSEEALRTSEGRYRSLFKSMTEGFALHEIITDANGTPCDYRFLEINPAFERLTGLSRESTVGKTVRQVIPFLEARWIETYGRVVATGTPVHIEDYTAPLDRWFEVFAYRTAPGQFAVLFTDITRRKRTEEERKRIEGQLREAESQYRRIIETANEGIWILDEESKTRYVNAKMAEMFGYTIEEMAGRSLFDFVTPEEKEITHGNVARRRAGIAEQHDFKFKRKDGSDFWALISTNPIQDEAGRYIGALGMVTDITTRKLAEEERETSLEFLRLMNDSQDTEDLVKSVADFFQRKSGCAAVGIRLRKGDDYPYYETRGFSKTFILLESSLCSRDQEGRMCLDSDGNPILECMCGNVICGRFDPAKPFFTAKGSFWTNSTSDLLAQTTEADRQARTRNLCHGQGYESVALIALRSGEERLGLLQLNDERTGYFNIDIITFWERLADYLSVALSKLAAEEALLKINENLEQRIAERTELAESRSRQLQSLAVELIEAEERERRRIAGLLHEDLQQLLAGARFILQSVSEKFPHASELGEVERMLADSIGKSRSLAHELSPAVLHHSGLTAALEWLSLQMHEQFGLNVQLEVALAKTIENTPLKVFLFRSAKELLFNIVKHAEVKNAHVALFESDAGLDLTVSDIGAGFDPSILEKSTPRGGLGLLTLRERARYMGGSLIIESTPGKGSRIKLTVPLKMATIPDVQPPATGVEEKSRLPAGRDTVPAPSNIRVLFADDHKVMRQGLVRLISAKPNIEVVGEAANGLDACELTAQLKPDVVVMDVSMPEMDGIEATRRIKAHQPQVRVIGLSMYEDEHISRKMRAAGAEAFVSKAASSAELLKAIYGMER
jgi:PAS domain S-box-containing protein